ncbi:uncharacterized protein LOC143296714 [Babylonia areolata]|uniref:uncharacterized protein LOC143296714 n=1 Tax=Babylonia areolata TaxID=304850 RepID=UPI003FCFDE04
MVAFLVGVVLLPLFFISSHGDAQTSQAVLLSVVDAIEKLVGFYKANYNDLNLDGLFGLRVMEGQLQKILQEHDEGRYPQLSHDVVQRLHTLLQDTRWVGEQAVSVVQADDEKYFKELGVIITQPWTVFKRPRKVVPAHRWNAPVYLASKNVRLDEHQSDICMMEITQPKRSPLRRAGGHGSEGGCSLSEHCGRVMTARGLTDYGITHQLLWTVLAEQSGCGEQMDVLMQGLGFNSTEHMQQEFCTNNFYEMLTTVHIFLSGTVTGNFQDLFMEQQFVCPSLGFYEFLKKDYLDQILSWQLPTGCFGENAEDEAASDNLLQNFPLEKDLKTLQSINRMSKLSDLGQLDLKKAEVEQQLKNLQSFNVLQESDAESMDGGRRDRVGNLQGQLQHPQGSRNVAVWNQAAPQQQRQQELGDGRPAVRNPGSVLLQQLGGQQRGPAGQLGPQRRGDAVYRNRPQRVGENGAGKLHGHFPPAGFQEEKMDIPAGVRGRLPEPVPGGHRGNFPDRRIKVKAGYDMNNFPRLPEDKGKAVYKTKNFPRLPEGKGKAVYKTKNFPHLPEGKGKAMYKMKNFPHLPEDLSPKEFPGQAVPSRGRGGGVGGRVPGRPEALRDRQVAAQFPGANGNQAVGVRVMDQRQQQPLPLAPDSQFGGRPRQRVLAAYETGQGSQRRLLVEKDMPGGCLSHKTGVACGALAMYLRYLVDPGPLSLMTPHQFYADTHQGLLGDGAAFRKVLEVLGQKLAKKKNLMDNVGLEEEPGEGDIEEREDKEDLKEEDEGKDGREEEEREEDKEEEERYPDAGEVERNDNEAVHLGADKDPAADLEGGPDKEDDNDLIGYRKEAYANGKEGVEEEEEDEEEAGPDYIKRAEGGGDKAAQTKSQTKEDAVYTYYEGRDKGAVKKHKAQAPQPPRSDGADASQSQDSVMPMMGPIAGRKDLPPTKALVLLLTAVSLALIFLLCKFTRKRRIHLKFGSRAFVRF